MYGTIIVNALTGRLIIGLAPADRTLPRAVAQALRFRDIADTYVQSPAACKRPLIGV